MPKPRQSTRTRPLRVPTPPRNAKRRRNPRMARLGNQNARKHRLVDGSAGEPEPVPVKDRAAALVVAQRARFTSIQASLMERALNPVEVNVPIPQTKADLVKMQVELWQLNYDRKITASDFSLGNQAINNLTRIMESTEIEDRLNELEHQAQAAILK